MTLKILVLAPGRYVTAFSHGIWRLIDVDFNRYGDGGVEAIVYAMTLLA